MPKPARGPRLGSGPAHERAMLRNLSRSLITHGRIVTTETKAKRLRPVVEKLVTKARKGGLHHRRLVLRDLQDPSVVRRLFDDVAPRTGERPGGYTRIMKLGPRRGDATPMAIIEFVDADPSRVPVAEEEPKRGRRRRRRSTEETDDTEAATSETSDVTESDEPAAEADTESEAT